MIITVTGNLGKECERRFTPEGTFVGTFSVADNTVKDKTQWVRCSWFGKQAETVSQYLTKGKTVTVTGRGSLKEWTGKDEVSHTNIELIVLDLQLVGGGKSAEGQSEDDLAF